MPVSEFEQHKWFWDNYRWGMSDDLLSISITNQIKSAAPKARVEPWQVKQWTTQKDYTYRMTRLIIKPVAAIRSGFMAVVNAIKGMKK
jgi:hypothetical protein